jgi:hypothetical protein
VGAYLFPAVMAIFSGIEFLDALDFPKPFDRHDDEDHFKHFWSQIYRTDPRKCSGASIRTTVRHGIAHAFMPQISYGIMLERSAKDHLVRDHDGAVLVSVGILIDDFTTAYRRRYWPDDAAARDLAGAPDSPRCTRTGRNSRRLCHTARSCRVPKKPSRIWSELGSRPR